MPKSKKSKPNDRRWFSELDVNAIRSAMDEATVDAYDPEEQISGLFNVLVDELEFPFQVSVLGEKLTATNIEMARGDNLGLDLLVDRNGQTYRIEVRSVELVEPLPEGHLTLAAYLHWKKCL